MRDTRLILLTSSGQRGDDSVFALIGFAGYLHKPVTQRDLTECLALALASTAESWHLQSQPIITASALQMQRPPSRRVLVADDNLVNQKVALRLLDRLGYDAQAVTDGRAAVDAWRAGRVDLILMDCHMPEMDGFEATREIRRLELSTHIPIIALTADAMQDVESLCRAAGMDDYLTKPIDRSKLKSCLLYHLRMEEPPGDRENSYQVAPSR